MEGYISKRRRTVGRVLVQIRTITAPSSNSDVRHAVRWLLRKVDETSSKVKKHHIMTPVQKTITETGLRISLPIEKQ